MERNQPTIGSYWTLRILGAVFLGYIGLQMGQFLGRGHTGWSLTIFTWTPLVGMALLGALASPPLFIPLLRWAWGLLRTIRPLQLVLGGLGLVAGLLVAFLLAPSLAALPFFLGSVMPFFFSVLLGVLGAMALLSREDELAHRLPIMTSRGLLWFPRHFLVDTSAIIDGRIADVYAAGFLPGELVVPRFVLGELRRLADSSDALRRSRGRRGLEVLARLQEEAPVPPRIAEDDVDAAGDVDSRLVKLARLRGYPIVTNDFNLGRVAEVEGVRVLNINRLAQALKMLVQPGEQLSIQLIQEGREAGQGVGYLDDGTMVVVEGGRRHLNEVLEVVVTRVLQTATGRLIFAQPAKGPP